MCEETVYGEGIGWIGEEWNYEGHSVTNKGTIQKLNSEKSEGNTGNLRKIHLAFLEGQAFP